MPQINQIYIQNRRPSPTNMTVKAALNKRERTYQIYMKNSEFMKAQELLGLTGPACHHLGGQEQRVGVGGPPAREVGISLLKHLLPFSEASGNINELLAGAGLEVKVQGQLPAFLRDNSKALLYM